MTDILEQAREIVARNCRAYKFCGSHERCACTCRDAASAILALTEPKWREIDDEAKAMVEIDLSIINSAGARKRITNCHFHCGEWLNWNGDDGDDPRWHNVEGENEGDVIWKATHYMRVPARPLPPNEEQ